MSEIDPHSTGAPHGEEPTGRLLLHCPRQDRIRDRIVAAAVIAAIAAVGVAILAPIFAAARQKARNVWCLSNVKQLCLATSLYAQDYDARMPKATRWIDLTLPYAPGKDEALYRCPALKQNPPDDYGYAFDSVVSMMPTADLIEPERTPLLYDTDLLFRNACAPDLMGLLRSSRHNGVDSIGYADGHAQYMRMDQTR